MASKDYKPAPTLVDLGSEEEDIILGEANELIEHEMGDKMDLLWVGRHNRIESPIGDGTTHEMGRDLKEETLTDNDCASQKRITRAYSKKERPIIAKRHGTNRGEPAHPSYTEMILTAIRVLDARGGSSRHAILKYVTENYPVSKQSPKRLNSTLVKLVKQGELEQVKGKGARGSYKNSDPTPSGSTSGRTISPALKWNKLEIMKRVTKTKNMIAHISVESELKALDTLISCIYKELKYLEMASEGVFKRSPWKVIHDLYEVLRELEISTFEDHAKSNIYNLDINYRQLFLKLSGVDEDLVEHAMACINKYPNCKNIPKYHDENLTCCRSFEF